jgi:crotonobetainyl-CoA:carnitine CoA-transferase CaiB-like acyl-CoA transferase
MLDLPLQGIRVLDLTRLAPGPYASLALADLGAEIIKIEEPPRGDPLRYLFPSGANGSNVLFELLNRNKKSMTLNLKAPEGRAILLELASGADVLLEGFRPGVMKRLDLEYEAVSAVNQALVYISISGYGQTGPYRLRAAHDLNYLALGGLLAITGTHHGPPVAPGVPVADFVSGLWAALAAVAGLLGRERSTRGQHVDLSMLDGVVSLLTLPLADWLATGHVPRRGTMPLSGKQACYNVYETADGEYMSLAALEPRFWRAFCLAVGRPEWLERKDEADQACLTRDVAALFQGQPRAYWTRLFAAHDCCCEPVLDLDEVFAHPQVVDRGLLREGQLATASALQGLPRVPAPRLGEHTALTLAELGYTSAEVDQLRQRGVV